MNPAELIDLKRSHARRLANQNGASGEGLVLNSDRQLIKRPTGKQLQNLLAALAETGIQIRKTSFDALSVPADTVLDLDDIESVRAAVAGLVFVEIKTASQPRVKSDFSGFFFAFTEGELLAAEALGSRHRVILVNRETRQTLETTIAELLDRARSTNWQVSVQL